jgi:hypothetical protein
MTYCHNAFYLRDRIADSRNKAKGRQLLKPLCLTIASVQVNSRHGQQDLVGNEAAKQGKRHGRG